VTKAVLAVLRAQGSGHIVQVSSIGGRLGTPGLSAYQSAKWAIGGFSSVLAQEVGPLGITVTVAGSSMTVPPVSAPYEATVGETARRLKANANTGPSDPVNVAMAVLKITKADNPPLRLLIGSDAVHYGRIAGDVLAASDAQWRELSESVGIDGHKQTNV
jgi:NAD(P)-dependent dehydrogenase (short-subunit alcohol dehydrogenase family)